MNSLLIQAPLSEVVVKEWLKRNKIYFETITPVLISISALLVSISSYQLNQKQLEFSLSGAKPHFYFNEVYLYDEKLKRAYETELRIFNSGADISDFKKSITSIIEVEFDTRMGRQIGYIPLNGYYNESHHTSSPHGELVLIKGHLNNEIYSDTYFKVLSNQFRAKYGSVFLSLKHAILISYTDKLGQPKRAYFIDEKSVSQETYEKFTSHFDGTRVVDLRKLSVDTISKLVSPVISSLNE